MSRIVDQFDPATETSSTFNGGFSNGTGRIIVYNQSPNNLNLSWDAFQTYCPAWTAMLYCVTSSSVNLNWVIQSSLQNQTTPPISQVTIVALDANESAPGTFPYAIMHQTSIGNAVSTNVVATATIDNEGNAPFSDFFTVIPTDTASQPHPNTFYANNAGTFIVHSDDQSVLTTLLQLIAGQTNNAIPPQVILAATATVTEVLGNLQCDAYIQANASGVVYNGSTAGSCTFYAPVWGPSLKVFVVTFGGFSTALGFGFALPTSLARAAFIMGSPYGGSPYGCKFQRSGADVSAKLITALAASGGSATSQITIPGNSLGYLPATADTFWVQSNNNNAVDGAFVCIGN